MLQAETKVATKFQYHTKNYTRLLKVSSGTSVRSQIINKFTFCSVSNSTKKSCDRLKITNDQEYNTPKCNDDEGKLNNQNEESTHNHDFALQVKKKKKKL